MNDEPDGQMAGRWGIHECGERTKAREPCSREGELLHRSPAPASWAAAECRPLRVPSQARTVNEQGQVVQVGLLRLGTWFPLRCVTAHRPVMAQQPGLVTLCRRPAAVRLGTCGYERDARESSRSSAVMRHPPHRPRVPGHQSAEGEVVARAHELPEQFGVRRVEAGGGAVGHHPRIVPPHAEPDRRKSVVRRRHYVLDHLRLRRRRDLATQPELRVAVRPHHHVGPDRVQRPRHQGDVDHAARVDLH